LPVGRYSDALLLGALHVIRPCLPQASSPLLAHRELLVDISLKALLGFAVIMAFAVICTSVVIGCVARYLAFGVIRLCCYLAPYTSPIHFRYIGTSWNKLELAGAGLAILILKTIYYFNHPFHLFPFHHWANWQTQHLVVYMFCNGESYIIHLFIRTLLVWWYWVMYQCLYAVVS
jgi:hypothetical protein